MKTQILPCFDTEDFTSMRSAEAAARVAELLAGEGVKGSFMFVGLLAKELVRNRRYDIIEALGRHEINFHTKGHTVHPNICEYTDTENFSTAAARLLRDESEGMGMVEAAFGVDGFAAAVPPGPSWSYAAMVMYSEMGIPVYADTPLRTADGRDVFYCGALHIEYFRCFESDIMKPDGLSDAEIDAFKDELARRKRAIIYNHPNRLAYSEFWDAVNYNRKNCVYGEWKEARRLTDAQVEEHFDTYRRIIRSIKADERFEFTTPAAVAREVASRPERVLRRADIPAVRAALERSFGPLSEPCSLSLSEVFAACLAFLGGADEYSPERVYGFLRRPVGIASETRVSADEVRAAAAGITAPEGAPFFLPENVVVGGKALGAADFLFAMLAAIDGVRDISLAPRDQLNDMSMYPALTGLSLKNAWMYQPEFRDEYLSDRLRLQAWTLRY